MRSAIYYPRTQVHSKQIMKSSLLLWDQLHTIIPMENHKPEYGDRRDMAEAWELIGATIVPNATQRQRTHVAIETTLRAGGLPQSLYRVGQIDQPSDVYEIWPQKFSMETWDLMREHRLTNVPLPNGDYPFTQEGGLLVMAKLADACAGTQFARVTDRLMAYGMIGTGAQRPGIIAEVVPITLDIIDASSIPMQSLIDFRKREVRERNGRDYQRMRHNYADMVQQQASALSGAVDQRERDEMNRQFRFNMENELQDLRELLGRNVLDFVLKPVVVAAVVTGGSLAAGVPLSLALSAGATAAIGSDWKEIAGCVTDFFQTGVSFSRQQQEMMLRNPMAYMYSLSSVR
ncbi:hypothetical protein [Brucella pseudogrignonensis]|uniref:hypothetical protein n=1 Tax=Brucella pseudogrignonensis TaxID=419475 RepID=UPI00124D5D65|nr:hypothetical protein [Brucella pseudogrignonensis]KAB2686791.1 hypothetical protein F9K82_18470 [Brucella pseudogrignonensis]